LNYALNDAKMFVGVEGGNGMSVEMVNTIALMLITPVILIGTPFVVVLFRRRLGSGTRKGQTLFLFYLCAVFVILIWAILLLRQLPSWGLMVLLACGFSLNALGAAAVRAGTISAVVLKVGLSIVLITLLLNLILLALIPHLPRSVEPYYLGVAVFLVSITYLAVMVLFLVAGASGTTSKCGRG